jgi:hypothetical protein
MLLYSLIQNIYVHIDMYYRNMTAHVFIHLYEFICVCVYVCMCVYQANVRENAWVGNYL